MSRIHTLGLIAIVLASFAAVPVFGADEGHADHGNHAKPHADHPDAQATTRIGGPFPLFHDPVSGAALADVDAPVVRVVDHREFRFATEASADAFAADPAKYLPAIDAAISADQKPLYPMTTCMISGDKLDQPGGEDIDLLYGNRLIRLCCKGCKKDFLKDPDAKIAELDAAVIAQQSAAYAATTCPISGAKLGSMGEPVDRVFAGRLVRFCCGGCIAEFAKNLARGLVKLYPSDGVAPATPDPAPAGDHAKPNEAVHGHDHAGHSH